MHCVYIYALMCMCVCKLILNKTFFEILKDFNVTLTLEYIHYQYI